MKKLFATFCAIAALSSFSGFALAAPSENHGQVQSNGYQKKSSDCQCSDKHNFSPEQRAMMEKRKAEIQKRLNLTAEQKEQMKALHANARTQIKPLFDQFKTEREKMQQLRQSNAPKEEIQAQREKIKAIREQMKAIREAQRSKINAILTPAQQEEFKKIHEEFKAEHKNTKWQKKDSKGDK